MRNARKESSFNKVITMTPLTTNNWEMTLLTTQTLNQTLVQKNTVYCMCLCHFFLAVGKPRAWIWGQRWDIFPASPGGRRVGSGKSQSITNPSGEPRGRLREAPQGWGSSCSPVGPGEPAMAGGKAEEPTGPCR